MNPMVVFRKACASCQQGCSFHPHRSCLVYQFERWNCESWYVGRTLQRLNTRIQQHVPLHLLNTNVRTDKSKRWRPRKMPSVAQGSLNLCGMETWAQKRTMQPPKCKATPEPLKCNTTTAPDSRSAKDYSCWLPAILLTGVIVPTVM